MDLLKSIQVFEQVAQQQSFSRAAESLNLVPSAVSRQINELEKWLDIRLINRTTRSLSLTEDGKAYLLKLSDIRAQVTELRRSKTQLQQIKGLIKITAPIMIGQYMLPVALAEFKELHQDVDLAISLMNRKVELVEEGFDLAIRVGHLNDSTMVARNIGNMHFKTVASPHYINTHGMPSTPKDLKNHQCLINTAVTNAKRWSYLIDGKSTVIKVAGSLEVNDSQSLKAFAIANQGIAQLPSFYVDAAIQSGELIEILSDYVPSPLPVNLLYPSQRLLSPTVRALVDYLVPFLNQQKQKW
ncbi:LysR family transcriptional regulator [Pseudoalteromonas distincta]|uniref:LysR family transcriptional regulator n=1 Tax=Pseudoalteromonas distincta TaxID=77608 RepID=A0A4P9IXY8_9GAMM|nr:MULTISPECIES: LysR family transcriptional regulator [Pseudoalteromonas distincta group]KHM49900.1 LysR family transcriptional regulator [Pseudoalteromonas elyakovii]KID40627.1 LysR family transcriptional regulator [Pseudoalteromonas distincta]MDP4482613.1 LysR family transcriptional regulator [Pseudoalteromonas elyakovii]QCU73332.1 LysR family transcriptional regulator [Pseudoalteromonas distincta]